MHFIWNSRLLRIKNNRWASEVAVNSDKKIGLKYPEYSKTKTVPLGVRLRRPIFYIDPNFSK